MAIKGMSVRVVDNSGAKTAEVFHIPGNSLVKTVTIGALVKVAVKTALPKGQGKVSKGEISDAIVVSLKNPVRRKNGTIAQSDVNGVVLIAKNAKGEISMVGTRVLSMVAQEILDLYPDIASLAPGRY